MPDFGRALAFIGQGGPGVPACSTGNTAMNKPIAAMQDHRVSGTTVNTLAPAPIEAPQKMDFKPVEYRTSIATLRAVSPQLIEILYHANIVFTAATVTEVQNKRRELMGNSAYGTLTIIPEEVDYNIDAMGKDQGIVDRSDGKLIATAVVVKASMIEMLTRLYLSYFPQLHHVFITHDEQAARTWMAERLSQAAA